MTRTRAAFTLVELLVVLAVALVLAGIAALVLPGVLSQDRTTDGAATLRQYLMIAKNRAARDGMPRGVRLITELNPIAPKTAFYATEIQEIEVPSVMIFNPNQTTTQNLVLPPATGLTTASPHVEVIYTPFPTGATAGAIQNRQMILRNLTAEQAEQVAPGSSTVTTLLPSGVTINVPEFGNFWAKVPSVTRLLPSRTIGMFDLVLNLNNPTGIPNDYPDDYMGATTQAISYRFGINGLPAPLMGQPAIQLPKNICVDLTPTNPANQLPSPVTTIPTGFTPAYSFTQNPSIPAGVLGADYDILFAPSGQVLNRGAVAGAGGQIFLWVRDYTKLPVVNPNPLRVVGAVGTQFQYDMEPFRIGGEQQIVALKTASGALGVFPVTWPQPNGVYAAGQTPFSFAQAGATSP